MHKTITDRNNLIHFYYNALRLFLSVNDFQLGMTNRTCAEQMLPGGKGINVSTVLYNLGIETKALGFSAGFTGKEIERRMA